MERKAAELKKAKNILIVGGGALGIREWIPDNSALRGPDAELAPHRIRHRSQRSISEETGHFAALTDTLDADISDRDARC